jgi:lipoate-protein ligase A
MRGECKTPGGKLVAADVFTAAGRIQKLHLSGDFFVHPAEMAGEILERLTQAATGQPVQIESEQLAEALNRALPWDAELIGTSAAAMAVAIRRALGDPSAQLPDSLHPPDHQALSSEEIQQAIASWLTVAWHILPERPLSPALNVALDEVLCQRVASGERPATLRFWRWSRQAVILGRCQSVKNEVDQVAARESGISVVRRMTGGGAMFLQPHGAITYSLYLPEQLLSGIPVRQSYQICEAWVIDCLRQLGVDAFHAPLNDIACSMGKIGGAAQARRRGVVLHHTTMAYDMDPGEMVRVLRIGKEKLSDKPAVASAAKRVSPLVRQTGLPRNAIVAALQQAFQERFGGILDELTPIEMRAAEGLVESKYNHPSWTLEIA